MMKAMTIKEMRRVLTKDIAKHPGRRRQKDMDRDQLAHDVEAFLSKGGEIEQLPGPLSSRPIARQWNEW